MKSGPRICVVGSANVDVTIRSPRFPRPGETLSGHSCHLGMGGKGANQAVAAARLGAHVALVARVGADAFGQEAVRSYEREGIDTSFILRDARASTGTAVIIVDDKAENCILVVGGANSGLSPDDVRAAAVAVKGADVLLCQLETPVESTLEAFRLARAAGVRTILTPAPAADLSDELLSLCDICVPNETEIELLTGKMIGTFDDAELAAKDLLARGVGAVVVTLGSRGALIVDNDTAQHIPAINVEAVDPTGAGDAFTAALAVFIANGLSIREAARKATAVAALTITRIGTQAIFPFRAEVEEWFASRQG
jgi:ribokinase